MASFLRITKFKEINIKAAAITGLALLLCGVENIAASGMVEDKVPGLDIKGNPRVVHFGKGDYHSDSQFWTMAEDGDGVLYFGNNDGILVYDGERWTQVKLPNGSTVRSLKYASDGNVYVGGYNEIGTVRKNKYGQYHYESLKGLLRQEDQNFEDVWQIVEAQGYVVFRSFKMLIAIAGQKAVTLPAHQRFAHDNVVGDTLYVAGSWGLKRLDLSTMEFENIVGAGDYNNEEVSGILPGRNNKELIVFTKAGNAFLVYPQTKKSILYSSHFLPSASDQIFCAIKAANGLYCLGTINSQIVTFQFSEKGLVETRDVKSLQDNTVLNLYQTHNGNVWALLNKGIDCIEMSSPVSLVFENAAIYDAIEYHHKFYLATNQGVYVANLTTGEQYLSRADFRIIPGLEAQAWSLRVYEDKLLVGHDKGVFVIDDGRQYHVDGTNGIWKVIPIQGHPNKYLACAYNGLYLLHYGENGKFVLENKIEGFDVSGKDILQSNQPGVFWICHGYKGVYRIKIDGDFSRAVSLEHYTDQNGLPSSYNINIFKWQNDTVFISNHGIYTFDQQRNQFVPDKTLNNILGKDPITRKLLQHGDKTWFVQDDELGYFYTGQPEKGLHKNLFLSLKGTFIKNMELVLPLGQHKTLVGTNNGLYLFDLSYKASSQPVRATVFTQVRYNSPGDSLVYCPLVPDKNIQIPYNTSGLTFDFAAPKFNAQTGTFYSVKLENVDKNWSDWSAASEKEYSYLKSGSYVFWVKSRSALGEQSEAVAYQFEILPVWYQTTLYQVVFSILAFLIILLIVVLVRRKIKKTRLEEQKVRRVLELEIEHIKLEREKEQVVKDKAQLEEDVVHKSKELANYTMLLVRKRELLTEMNQELAALKETVKNNSSKEKIRAISRKINLNLQDEGHLQVFDANFERVHQEFFFELKSSFPDLSQKELRLCGFVKMNLANKEIASILNISVRGVETARYRLRKRLSIDHETNMVEFLETLSSAQEEGTDESDGLDI